MILKNRYNKQRWKKLKKIFLRLLWEFINTKNKLKNNAKLLFKIISMLKLLLIPFHIFI